MILELINVPCASSCKITFSLYEKEMIAIKGTPEQIKNIYEILVNYQKPVQGSIILFGYDYKSMTGTKKQKTKKRTGIVSKEKNFLIPNITAYENIALSVLISTNSQEQRERNINNINLFLRWFDLEDKKDILAKDLSEKDYFLIYFLREITKAPSLFIIHNVFNTLDDKLIVLIFLFLSKITSLGISVLILDQCRNFDFLYVNRVIQI